MSELLKCILTKLYEFALINNLPKSKEEVGIIAGIWEKDLLKKGETDIEMLNQAFDIHRDRTTQWPTPAMICTIIDSIRINRQFDALPIEPTPRQQNTPGLGILTGLLLKYGYRYIDSAWMYEDLQRRYAQCVRTGRPWPRRATEQSEMIHALYHLTPQQDDVATKGFGQYMETLARSAEEPKVCESQEA